MKENRTGMTYKFDKEGDIFRVSIQINMSELREVELVKADQMHMATKDLLNKANPISKRISAIATIFEIIEHWKKQDRKPALADFHQSFRKNEGKRVYVSSIPIIKRLAENDWNPYPLYKADIGGTPLKNISWIYHTYKDKE